MKPFRPLGPCRRRRLLLTLPALGASLLAGCGALGLPTELTLTQQELDERLARRFPRTQRVLEVLDLTLSDPRVRLMPESNRLACDFALGLRERLFDAGGSGRIAFDTGLRWEPADASLRLAQVAVQRLELQGLPGALQSQASRAGRLLAEQLLEGFTLWQMPAEQQQRLRRAGLDVGTIEVQPQGLVVHFARGAAR
ncbi:DUF1439 domain-containing protein [Azohydromonas lata]|uniref:DUF1439 domain-containing protein n=1 Tax=Azohydromonas lata TaxID=45677 RepID=UPI00082E6538|nr:DUF1439 domain-containing protein [Azohydromonas lata]